MHDISLNLYNLICGIKALWDINSNYQAAYNLICGIYQIRINQASYLIFDLNLYI